MFTPSLRPAALALILAMGTAACNMADSDVAPIAMIKTDAQSIADGRTIAEAQCSNCHALDQDAKIRPEDPPPLRYLLAQYNPNTLSEDFQAGLHVGHNMMPRAHERAGVRAGSQRDHSASRSQHSADAVPSSSLRRVKCAASQQA